MLKDVGTHSALGVTGKPIGLPTRSPYGEMASCLCLFEESVLPPGHVPMRGGVGQTKASASVKESTILCLLQLEAGLDAVRKEVWTKPKGSKVLTSSPCDLPLN